MYVTFFVSICILIFLVADRISVRQYPSSFSRSKFHVCIELSNISSSYDILRRSRHRITDHDTLITSIIYFCTVWWLTSIGHRWVVLHFTIYVFPNAFLSTGRRNRKSIHEKTIDDDSTKKLDSQRSMKDKCENDRSYSSLLLQLTHEDVSLSSI